MLLVPYAPEFGWRLHTHAGRPATAQGVSVTPGNNTKGSWAELIDGALVTTDVWAIEVIVQENNVSTAIRDTLLDIGIDPTAGTSYSVVIPDLLCSDAGAYTGQGIAPYRYYFPLFIPAGSSIAARASVNNATVGTLRCYAILHGKPKHPEITKAGSVVQAIGVTAGSSRGTTVTPGTTSDGAWTSLGTVSRAAWWWQLGVGIADASVTGLLYAADLSAGSAGGDKMIIEEALVMASSSETVTVIHPYGQGVRAVGAGATVYGRMQGATTADTTVSMIAYALS